MEYIRINPEVAIYNAQTGIDNKLYEKEISGSSKFNAATKSNSAIWKVLHRLLFW